MRYRQEQTDAPTDIPPALPPNSYAPKSKAHKKNRTAAAFDGNESSKEFF